SSPRVASVASTADVNPGRSVPVNVTSNVGRSPGISTSSSSPMTPQTVPNLGPPAPPSTQYSPSRGSQLPALAGFHESVLLPGRFTVVVRGLSSVSRGLWLCAGGRSPRLGDGSAGRCSRCSASRGFGLVGGACIHDSLVGAWRARGGSGER